MVEPTKVITPYSPQEGSAVSRLTLCMRGHPFLKWEEKWCAEDAEWERQEEERREVERMERLAQRQRERDEAMRLAAEQQAAEATPVHTVLPTPSPPRACGGGCQAGGGVPRNARRQACTGGSARGGGRGVGAKAPEDGGMTS